MRLLIIILVILFLVTISSCAWGPWVLCAGWGTATHLAANHKLKSCQAYIDCLEEGRSSSECEKLRKICYGSYTIKGEYGINEKIQESYIENSN